MYVQIDIADLLAYEASGGRVTSDERTFVTNNVVDLQAPYESVAEFLMVVEPTFKRRRAVTKEGLAFELHKEEKYDYQTLIVYGNATEYVQWRNVLNDAKLEHSHRGMSYLDKGKKVINLMSKTEFKNGYNQTNPVYRIFCSGKSAVDIALKKFKAVFVYVLDHGMAKDPKFLYLKHNHCKVNVIYHQYHDDDMKNELLDRLASTEKITLCFDSTIKEKIFSKSLRRVQGQVSREKHQSSGIMHVDWPDFAIATTNYVNEVIFLGAPHHDNTAYIVHSLMMNKNPVTVHVLYIDDDVKQVYVKKVFSKI